MFKEILCAVQQRLLNLPQLRYVAEDWGQLSYYGPHHPVQFPCVLIDVSRAEYSNAAQNLQQADVLISVRIADSSPVNVSAKSPDPEKGFQMLELIDAVYSAIQGLSSEDFSPLTRVSFQKELRDDKVRLFHMTFRCGFTDYAAQKKGKSVSPSLDLEI